MTVRDAAEAIADDLRRGDPDFALRMVARLVADLRATADADLDEFLAGPPTTGDRRWDTLLAGVVSRECRRRGVPAPDWTRTEPLATWWFPVADPVLTARTMQRTPIDLSVRGIWLDAAAPETV